MQGEEDRLHQGLDRADGQGDAPVAGQGEGHQNRHGEVHGAIGHGLQSHLLQAAGQGVAVAVMAVVVVRPVLFASVHQLQTGGEGLGCLFDA
ncbi:hypothetical protein D3C80_1342010 [compost metagenome]